MYLSIPCLVVPQLYREAGFWNLKQMQRAIEEEKVIQPISSHRLCLSVCCRTVCLLLWSKPAKARRVHVIFIITSANPKP